MHPDPGNRDTAAVGFIQIARQVVYPHPCLLASYRANTGAKRSVDAKRELERRKLERAVLQELSRYYPLEQGKNTWKRPQLLRKGEHRLGRSMR